MKKLIFIFCIGALFLVAYSCTETSSNEPVENDGVAPSAVSNVTVENLSGSAIISYELPNDDDLLYVKAVYTTERGVEREVKASYYTNKLTVIGFGASKAYDVKLYAVDKGENVSAPTSTTVTPLTPSYLIVGESVKMKVAFGGIDLFYENPSEESIAIVVLTKDEFGDFVERETAYTQLKEGKYPLRGLPPVETEFAAYVRDRWGNISETVFATITPFFEDEVDGSKVKGLDLPGDAILDFGGTYTGLFDGSDTPRGQYHSNNAGMPQWFTLDLGVTVKPSRLVWWMRGDGTRWLYNLHNPRKVEIWGSNNPSPDGSWDSWEFVVAHEHIKPSGLPVGELSNDDLAAAEIGETIDFPIDAKAYRYIRFKTLSNWSGGTYVNFTEMKIFGQPE